MAVSLYIRNFIFERDNYTCLKCGSTDKNSIDHVIPRSLGGSDAFFNLQTLCEPCNFEKADTYADYRDWVEFPALPDEEPFNWGLSYKDIDAAYRPKPIKSYAEPSQPFKELLKEVELKERVVLERSWQFPISGKKKNKKGKLSIDSSIPLQTDYSKAKHIIHQKRKCVLYGELNKRMGEGQELGQSVYFDEVEDRLIVHCFGTCISYHFETLERFVDKDIFAPKRKVYATVIPIQTVQSSLGDKPEYNFHEDAV